MEILKLLKTLRGMVAPNLAIMSSDGLDERRAFCANRRVGHRFDAVALLDSRTTPATGNASGHLRARSLDL